MVSLIKKGLLLDVSEQAPAPSKDYVNLRVTTTEIQWRYWKINPQCLRPDVQVTPTEQIMSHVDFIHDLDMQSEVKRVFGVNTLVYVKELCVGKYDFFARVSKALQVYVISFLDLEDIASLGQVSKHFRELCNSDHLWEHIVEKYCDTVTSDMKLYAQEVGWRQVFFTNKLQLQMQMRRRKQKSATFSSSDVQNKPLATNA